MCYIGAGHGNINPIIGYNNFIDSMVSSVPVGPFICFNVNFLQENSKIYSLRVLCLQNTFQKRLEKIKLYLYGEIKHNAPHPRAQVGILAM